MGDKLANEKLDMLSFLDTSIYELHARDFQLSSWWVNLEQERPPSAVAGTASKTGKLNLKTMEMETVYDLGAKMTKTWRRRSGAEYRLKSAFFALAVSDIVLINMCCHDIGREQAANKPLLNTVFQVMMRSFSQGKTSMMFVICRHDKDKDTIGELGTSA